VWERFKRRSDPAATAAVILAGRAEEANQLVAWLLGDPRRIAIRADSADEALAFWLAAIDQCEPAKKRLLLSKSLVVANEELASRLASSGQLHLGFRPPVCGLSSSLIDSGRHTLVVPHGNDARYAPIDLQLIRPSREGFAMALQSMGWSRERSDAEARHCGRSVTVLQRLHPSVSPQFPLWASPPTSPCLLGSVLAGGWDASVPGDREALATLCGEPSWEAVETKLHPTLGVAEPPIERIDSVWQLIAPVDAFQLLAPSMPNPQFAAFESVVSRVFGELDPALDLSPDDQAFAGIRGRVRRHSEWLRRGLANTLLLIAARGRDARISLPDSKAFVERLVRGLPGLSSDHRLIASLRHELPLLAEAAPESFLEALEQLIEQGAIAPIFAEGDRLFPTSAHTGVLRGLETLAWDPEHLGRVVRVLGALARTDPGGKLANRPANTLRNIFLPWLPGTTARPELRRTVLEALLNDEPTVGWALLVALLPEDHSATSGTHAPRWLRGRQLARLPIVTWLTRRSRWSRWLSNALVLTQVVGNR